MTLSARRSANIRPAGVGLSAVTLRAATAGLATVIGLAGLTAAATTTAQAPGGGERRQANPTATTARVLALHETGYLQLASHQGAQTLNERGRVSGTLTGLLAIQITLSYTQAAVSFTAYPKDGTLSGRGLESYYVSGNTGHFNGTMAVTGGSGRYRHASAASLRIAGTLRRKHYELSVIVTGNMKL